jgi:hypothetical protein
MKTEITNEKVEKQAVVMQSVMFNELRIGNYIQFSSGSIYPVDIIYKDYTLLKSWFAIPLNTEWLLLLKFQKIGVNFRKHDDCDREFVLWYNHNSKYYEVKGNNNFYELKYVHQLQNIYSALTGAELTVA